MTDRPILFSGPMVRALLDGKKTQTRRDLTKTFGKYPHLVGYETDGTLKHLDGKNVPHVEFVHSLLGLWHPQDNPRGRSGWYVPLKAAVGDRLWVRENAAVRHTSWHHEDGESHTVSYRADEDDSGVWLGLPAAGGGPRKGKAPSLFPSRSHNVDGSLRWQPSIHMPRWASRLTLTVSDVRVERLQDISEADALAEGVPTDEDYAGSFAKEYCHHCGGSGVHGAFGEGYGATEVDCAECETPQLRYRNLWNHINGDGAWESNPWIVAYTFTVQRGNIDQIARAA
ncbi:hypothetical protein [Rhizobium leguminosarum]